MESNAAQTGASPQGDPHQADEIDDLFNLGEASAAFRQELEVALAAVDEVKHAADLEPTVVTFRGDQTTSSAGAPPTAVVEPHATSVARAPAPEKTRKFGASHLTLAVLATLVLINALLVVFVSRSTASFADAVADLGSAPKLIPVATPPVAVESPSAGPVVLPEGYDSLERAQAEVQRGEHAFARRRLFSLLAVIDSVQEPARSDLEARAGVTIGDSYRLQAVALAAVPGGGQQ